MVDELEESKLVLGRPAVRVDVVCCAETNFGAEQKKSTVMSFVAHVGQICILASCFDKCEIAMPVGGTT